MNGTSIITIFCTIIGAVLGVLGALNYSKKETKEDTENSTEIRTDLRYISKGVDDIRLDIRAQGSKIENISDRLIRVEESTKSAHHRIDGLEEKKE